MLGFFITLTLDRSPSPKYEKFEVLQIKASSTHLLTAGIESWASSESYSSQYYDSDTPVCVSITCLITKKINSFSILWGNVHLPANQLVDLLSSSVMNLFRGTPLLLYGLKMLHVHKIIVM